MSSAAQDQKKKSTGISLIQFITGITKVKKNKIIKGGVLLGAFVTSIVGAILKNNQGNDYYDQYLESAVVDDIVDLRKKAENSYRWRNYFIAGVFTVWVIHLLDLKFSKKKGGLKGELKNNSIRFSLYYSF